MARKLGSDNKTAKHPAFAMQPITGYDVHNWQINEKLTNWDATFALGFTSYQSLIKFTEENYQTPVDEVREMLIRMYLLEPTFPIHFRAPNMQQLVDFLFNVDTENSAAGAEARKRCASLLAEVLGRNRGSGYRWLRDAENSENSVAKPILRLSSKVMSMDPMTSRSNFWKAIRGMATARSFSMDKIDQVLEANGVEID